MHQIHLFTVNQTWTSRVVIKKTLNDRLIIPEWMQEPIQPMNCYTNYAINEK